MPDQVRHDDSWTFYEIIKFINIIFGQRVHEPINTCVVTQANSGM